MRYRGFTLIEALVVIAILAVLFVILFPVFVRPHHGSRQSTCLNNQRQIALAVMMYASDNSGTLFPDPKTEAWAVKLKDYNEPSIYDCPSLTGKGKNINPEYGINANLFGHAFDIDEPTNTILTADLGRAGFSGSYAITSTDPATSTHFEKVLDLRHSRSAMYSAVDGHVAVFLYVKEGVPIADVLKKNEMHFAVTAKTP